MHNDILNQTYVWVGTFNPAIVVLLALIVVLITFIPSFIAFSRKNRSRTLIFILNLFFGWTGLGWLVLLVWALQGAREVSIV